MVESHDARDAQDKPYPFAEKKRLRVPLLCGTLALAVLFFDIQKRERGGAGPLPRGGAMEPDRFRFLLSALTPALKTRLIAASRKIKFFRGNVPEGPGSCVTS
jgi:hypothetical protein